MRKFFLSAVIVGLIAPPVAFAHGHSGGHTAIHSRHEMHRHTGRSSSHDMQARDAAGAGRNSRYVDEEELAVDELASKATDTRLTDSKAN